jgi:hypothetical protein
MSRRISSLARLALRQQVEFLGDGQVSLDSLWRAWGSPHGHDPRSWSELAAPLLSGFAAYLANLGGQGPGPDGALCSGSGGRSRRTRGAPATR